MDSKQTIRGKFFHTVYRQESNSFTVARFRLYELNEKNIVVTGYLPELPKDTLFTLTGTYVEHPKYGMQFAVESYEKQLPTDTDSVVAYLSGPLFPGIGKKYAETMVELLGADCLEKIKADEHVLDLVPKMNAKKRKALLDGICTEDDLQSAVQFFSTHGLGIRNIMRLDRIYGKESLHKVQENPYRLVEEVDGIGFKTADKLAQSMGVAQDDPRRIEAAVLAMVLEACGESGDSYLLYEELETRYDKEFRNEEVPSLDAVLLALYQRNQLTAEEDRIYHHTQYEAEEFISSYLCAPLGALYEKVEEQEVLSQLSQFEQEIGITYDEKQVEAICTFFNEDTMILTGGPGTGKTTVVRAMVELFQRIYPYFSIAVCAPTGRAAKRLSELTGVQSSTIHRLLKWDLETNRFAQNRDDPLNQDLLIVDEFSMVDQWLFYNLLVAGANFKKILIIGDEDQLPSVGIGAVLRDITSVNLFPLVRLTKIFRQAEGSDVIRLAHEVKNGQCMTLTDGKDVKFIPADAYEAKNYVLQLVSHALNKGYDSGEIQVLAPKYSGTCGIDALNNALQKACNPPELSKRELVVGYRTYREGDKILQLKNQPDDDVYNGDIGVLREILYAQEEDNKYNTLLVEYDGALVEYTPENFINITHAYCVSIHKAQGSEYPIVIMPVLHADQRMLSRRLLYTGLTRASKSLILVGEYEAFKQGIATADRHERRTTLAMRMKRKKEENHE